MMIPFLNLKAPHEELRQEMSDALERVLNSGWYIHGTEVKQFESEFSSYCQSKYCVGVGNGLEALHLILRAFDIGEGDEVIVPANTYIATIRDQITSTRLETDWSTCQQRYEHYTNTNI